MIKKYFRILKNPPAYFQAILKARVKFQKDRPKTVGGVKGTRYLLPIDFCNIRTQKMSKFVCLFDLGLTSLSTFFSHIATVSGCGRELNAHF